MPWPLEKEHTLALDQHARSELRADNAWMDTQALRALPFQVAVSLLCCDASTISQSL